MIRRFSLAAVLCAALPFGPVAAQRGVSPDSVFAQARRLVNEGQGAAGRALIDSLVRVAPEGSAARADAVYWRAQLAPDAVAARRDFVLLTVEYSLTPRAADALLGLAQIEFARGESVTARQYLERLVLEHPRAAAATEGWFWLGRARLNTGDAPGGCAALDSARSKLPPSDVERRNQVDFAAQPCRALAARGTAAPPATTTSAVVDASTAAGGAPPSATAPATSLPWTVQVAAFNTKAEADRLARTLKSRGYETRVWDARPNKAPYRVRIGAFATRAEATAMVTKLKAAKITAIVAEAEGR